MSSSLRTLSFCNEIIYRLSFSIIFDYKIIQIAGGAAAGALGWGLLRNLSPKAGGKAGHNIENKLMSARVTFQVSTSTNNHNNKTNNNSSISVICIYSYWGFIYCIANADRYRILIILLGYLSTIPCIYLLVII